MGDCEWSHVRLRHTWLTVEGDIICLAVELFVSAPQGVSCLRSRTASPAMGPPTLPGGPDGYHGGGRVALILPSACLTGVKTLRAIRDRALLPARENHVMRQCTELLLLLPGAHTHTRAATEASTHTCTYSSFINRYITQWKHACGGRTHTPTGVDA